MPRLSHAELVEALRNWAKNHDLHVTVAVNALIDQGLFLRRPEDVDAAVVITTDGAYINFRQARAAFDADKFMPASSTELALLDLAIAVGEDRYRFSRMGLETARFALDLLENVLGHKASSTDR